MMNYTRHFYLEIVTRKMLNQKEGFVFLIKTQRKLLTEFVCVLWWALMKLSIEKRLVRLVKSMFKNIRSRVRVNGSKNGFLVQVGLHQASALSCVVYHWTGSIILGNKIKMRLRIALCWWFDISEPLKI